MGTRKDIVLPQNLMNITYLTMMYLLLLQKTCLKRVVRQRRIKIRTCLCKSAKLTKAQMTKLDAKPDVKSEPQLESDAESESKSKSESSSRSIDDGEPFEDLSDKGQITTQQNSDSTKIGGDYVTKLDKNNDVITKHSDDEKSESEDDANDIFDIEENTNEEEAKNRISEVIDDKNVSKTVKDKDENLDMETSEIDDFEVVNTENLEVKNSSHETSTDVLYREALSSVKSSQKEDFEQRESIEIEEDNFVVIDPEGQNESVNDDDDSVQTNVQVDADKEWSPTDEEDQNKASKSVEVSKETVEMAIEDKKESKSVEEKDEGLEKAFGSADNVEKDTIDVVDQVSKIDDDFEVNVKAPMKEDMNEFTETHHEEKSDVH